MRPDLSFWRNCITARAHSKCFQNWHEVVELLKWFDFAAAVDIWQRLGYPKKEETESLKIPVHILSFRGYCVLCFQSEEKDGWKFLFVLFFHYGFIKSHLSNTVFGKNLLSTLYSSFIHINLASKLLSPTRFIIFFFIMSFFINCLYTWFINVFTLTAVLNTFTSVKLLNISDNFGMW